MQLRTAPLAVDQQVPVNLRPAMPKEGFSGLVVNYLIAGLVVFLISLFFLLSEPNIYHWLIIPAGICGLLMGADVVRWWRGFLDPFDPKALAGIIVFYGWFLAPLLHAYWNVYGDNLLFTGDPRHWMGVAASANAVGIISYKLSQRWSYNHMSPTRTSWQLVTGRLFPVLACALPVSFGAQIYFSWSFRSIPAGEAFTALQGGGWLLMLGDPLPVLLVLGFIMWTRSPQRDRNWAMIALIMVFAAMAQFIWAGGRGSRSAVVVGVFQAAGLVHYYWRRLRPSHLLLGMAVLVPFLHLYAMFYKAVNPRSFQSIQSLADIERQERISGRTTTSVLLGDLARADVQARIANEIVERKNNYHLRYGRIYLGSLSKLVPHTVWLLLVGDLEFKRAWDKGDAFVELNWGKTSRLIGFAREYNVASNVYGLTGEAMLNFGLPGVPLAWIFFGLLMGWFRRKMNTMQGNDTRWGIMPIICYSLMNIPVADSDNLVFATLRSLFMIFICVLLWSKKIKLSQNNNNMLPGKV